MSRLVVTLEIKLLENSHVSLHIRQTVISYVSEKNIHFSTWKWRPSLSIFLFLFTVTYYLRGQAIIIKDATSHDIIARYFHCEIKPRIMPTKGQTVCCGQKTRILLQCRYTLGWYCHKPLNNCQKKLQGVEDY